MIYVSDFPFDFQRMLNRAIGEVMGSHYISIWKSHESKFYEKMRCGVVLYKKPKNNNEVDYKKPRFDRRITSMRVFTHTKK